MKMLEIFRLRLTRSILSVTPNILKTRLAKALYNYNSPNIHGIDLVVRYTPLKTLPHQRILVNTKEFIGWNVTFKGTYEHSTNIVLKNILKEGDYVLEAGAHIGTETLIMGNLVAPQGRVFAFEPNKTINRRLKINILLNNLEDIVKTFDTALGQSNEDVVFYINETKKPNQGMSSKYNFAEDTCAISVPQITLDSWVKENNIHRIDFIKMDVQGAELDILKGASNTIAAFSPVIFTEADADYSINALYETISSFNYDLFLVMEDGAYTPISATQLPTGNWIAFPRKT